MNSWLKPELKVEKRKLGPSRWKKAKATTQSEKPVYSEMKKDVYRHSKRDSTWFPPSWWLPGDK